MRQPLVSDDHLAMRLQPRLDAAGLPVPEHNVTLPISTAYPFAVGGEPHLTGITGNRVSSEPLLSVLPEVVCTVDEDLVIQ